jgi:predicted ester cyclase
MQITSSENKLLIQWVIQELFNRKRTDVVRFLYAPNCHGNSPDGPYQGRIEFITGFAKYAVAFPDFRLNIDYLVSEGDRVIVHYTFRGTQTGSWGVLPPTGQTIDLPGVLISRIEKHRIVQQDFVWDSDAARRQFLRNFAAARDQAVVSAAPCVPNAPLFPRAA